MVEVLDTGLDPVQVVAAAPVGLFRDGVPPAGPARIAAGLHGDPDIEVELAEFSVVAMGHLEAAVVVYLRAENRCPGTDGL